MVVRHKCLCPDLIILIRCYMKYVASCSCGKDSLAMILALIEKAWPLDYVVFFDAGKEFKSIYRNWEKLKKILDSHGIQYACLQPPQSFDYYFAEHEVKTRDGKPKTGYSWCGGRCRWMTKIKVRAINHFYDQFGTEPIVEYVGIARDEPDRLTMQRSERTVKVYPLALMGMTENDCLVKCYKNGFDWREDNGIDLYDVLDRVSCWCCGNKNLAELRAMYRYLPEYWEALKAMQSRTDKPFREEATIDQLQIRFDRESKKQ